MLSQNEQSSILTEFPHIKLSYENIIHKKVYKSDYILAIPEGKKCFAWFTYYHSNPVCFIMELDDKQNICNVKLIQTSYHEQLSYGTILYGTYFVYSNNPFFTMENIFYYKGNNISDYNWSQKLNVFNTILTSEMTNISYNNILVIFGLPIICSTVEEMEEKTCNLKYKISNIQFHMFHRVNYFLSCGIDCFNNNIYSNATNKPNLHNKPTYPNQQNYPNQHQQHQHQPIQNKSNYTKPTYSNNKQHQQYHQHQSQQSHHQQQPNPSQNNPSYTKPTYTKPTYNQNQQNQQNYTKPNHVKEEVFQVKADINTDIYNLYSYDNNSKKYVYYDIACIPDYTTSVLMNKLFRHIKENYNLDALEESDDEEEFENEQIDRYVDLHKTYKMICRYNYKFKKWTPIKIA
jgi:hypothetical protein